MLEFRHPGYFLLLLVIPFLFYFSKKRKSASLSFSTLDAIQTGYFSWRILIYKISPFLRLAVLILFIAALARPQSVSAERAYDAKGVDIVVALDISGSMMAEDFKPENRLGVAKQEAKKFIRGRENDRIGLVIFAKKAFTQCPLTLDYEVVIKLLEDIQIGMIEDGTAIGMGLATSVNRLRDSQAKSKVIILLTDGENNSGKIDPITAAELANTFGIKVYTIGVGKGGLVPFPVQDPLFGKRYVQANVEIDEMTLKRIADLTGGQFFRARDPKSLSQIWDRINELETTEIKVKEYRSYDEQFHFLLLPALLLLLIEVLISRTVNLKVP